MVRESLDDGPRIAQLLASELDADGGDLDALAVVDADPDVEPTTDGAFAYAVVVVADEGADFADEGDDFADEGDEFADADFAAVDTADNGDGSVAAAVPSQMAEVYVQADRAYVEFVAGQSAAADAATEADLRVRPKAVRPPRTLVFVEDGREVKRVRSVFAAALAAADDAVEPGASVVDET